MEAYAGMGVGRWREARGGPAAQLRHFRTFKPGQALAVSASMARSISCRACI